MPEVNEETVLILSALLKKSLRSATWVHNLELVTTCLEVYLTPQKSAWEACILQYSIFSTKISHHQHLRIFFTESHKLGAVLELFSRRAMCISLTCHKHLITTTHCTMTRKLNAASLLFTNASESKRMIQASCKTKHIFNGGIRFLSHQWHLSTPNRHRFYNTCSFWAHCTSLLPLLPWWVLWLYSLLSSIFLLTYSTSNSLLFPLLTPISTQFDFK